MIAGRHSFAGRRGGLTWIELVIALAFAIVIGAFAYRSLTQGYVCGNEPRCKHLLRSLVVANEEYRERSGSYADGLGDLGDAELIDSVFAAGSQSGYDFEYTLTEEGWSCRGNPTTPGVTGDNFYYVDQTGVLRWSPEGPACATDPEVEDER